MITDAAQRVVNKETKAVERAAKKFLPDDTEGFQGFLTEFYSEEIEKEFAKTYKPSISSYSVAVNSQVALEMGQDDTITDEMKDFIDVYAANVAARHVMSSRKQLRAIVKIFSSIL